MHSDQTNQSIQMRKHIIIALSIAAVSTLSIASCTKEVEGCTDTNCGNFNEEATVDDGSCDCAEIPTDYSEFTPKSYSGQTDRLNMLAELTTEMKKVNSGGLVDADVLLQMFANEGSPFSFESSKQLKNKTFELVVDQFETWMIELDSVSQSAEPGSNGVAGRVESLDGEKTYAFNANGYEPVQLIEKGIMGATFFYQAVSVYMSEDKVGNAVDNSEVDPVKGTTMEHHWDEAFGYIGFPETYPSTSEGVRFMGKYVNDREELLGTGSALMNAIVKGRHGISSKDYELRDEAIIEAQKAWELGVAGTAVHYLNDGLSSITDDAIRNHALSEAWVFIWDLQFNSGKTISQTDIDAALAALGENLYEISPAQINEAKDILVAAFPSLAEVADQL